MKECNLKKTKIYQKISCCLPKCKKVFFGLFFLFFGGFVFFLCVFVLVFCTKAQKGYFPVILEFKIFVPPKGFFKILCFFPFSFPFGFPFCLPFQNSIFSLFFVHQPLFENINIFLVSFIFLFLAFSFPNVCMFL